MYWDCITEAVHKKLHMLQSCPAMENNGDTVPNTVSICIWSLKVNDDQYFFWYDTLLNDQTKSIKQYQLKQNDQRITASSA